MQTSEQYLQQLHAAELGPLKQASGIGELLPPLLFSSCRATSDNRPTVAVAICELAKPPGNRRYSDRTMRSWRKSAVERGALRVQFAEAGEWCDNSYIADLLQRRKLVTANARRAG